MDTSSVYSKLQVVTYGEAVPTSDLPIEQYFEQELLDIVAIFNKALTDLKIALKRITQRKSPLRMDHRTYVEGIRVQRGLFFQTTRQFAQKLNKDIESIYETYTKIYKSKHIKLVPEGSNISCYEGHAENLDMLLDQMQERINEVETHYKKKLPVIKRSATSIRLKMNN